jgi:hypothetical protein
MQGSFTCRKVGTRDRLFNVPSEERQAEDFYIQKNPTASAGFEPEASMRNTRPPKPSFLDLMNTGHPFDDINIPRVGDSVAK